MFFQINFIYGEILNIIKSTARYFAQKKYCQSAIRERANLSVFQEKPTFSMAIGILMIAFSYVTGLPAVVFLAALAVWLDKPLIGIIGGPLIYGISTLLSIIGIKLAGWKHVKALCAWMTRVILERILGDEVKDIGSLPEETTEPGVTRN
jgi:hypothetical protein